ncbi:hypothetical protein XENOCAPTIV_007341 [Xenoophorus captivus]|uniref:Uncharacterized protein n=1 Tax=Xenoophorus captivus TaxID=1517983 RepID=A0ABV0Q5E5_9TELE
MILSVHDFPNEMNSTTNSYHISLSMEQLRKLDIITSSDIKYSKEVWSGCALHTFSTKSTYFSILSHLKCVTDHFTRKFESHLSTQLQNSVWPVQTRFHREQKMNCN